MEGKNLNYGQGQGVFAMELGWYILVVERQSRVMVSHTQLWVKCKIINMLYRSEIII